MRGFTEEFKPEGRESIEGVQLPVVLQDALRATYDVHEALGEGGSEQVSKNQFGETAMRVDLESEKAVLEVLRRVGIPILVIAEEHGEVSLDRNASLLGILDGLDGSNRYQAGRGVELYGAMFGIFSSPKPTYNQYVTSGIMLHTTGQLFYTEYGKGTFVTDAKGNQETIQTSQRTQLDSATRIYINEYWKICVSTVKEKLGQFSNTDPRAYAAYFSDLAIGKVDIVVSATGKQNLELAIGYGIVREAGGVMIDMDGNDIGTHAYHEFGQDDANQKVIIAASNMTLAQAFIDHIKR